MRETNSEIAVNRILMQWDKPRLSKELRVSVPTITGWEHGTQMTEHNREKWNNLFFPNFQIAKGEDPKILKIRELKKLNKLLIKSNNFLKEENRKLRVDAKMNEIKEEE
ncbi:MAG: hypothetical protein DRG30_01385 [Epsilonproteobacteria bacterium]|nr:MAG: hypothetical protein DRG30_01385 [Campylobacterota bacterium]